MINSLLAFVLLATASPCRDKQIKQLAHSAQFVVSARVVEVKPTAFPTLKMWSGSIKSTQSVVYEVETVLKGNLSARRILVEHYLIYRSRTADTEVPQLSPVLFKGGNRHLLFLKANNPNQPERPRDDSIAPDAYYLAIDETCATITEEPKTNELIRTAISH